jgi:hypothetical protein
LRAVEILVFVSMPLGGYLSSFVGDPSLTSFIIYLQAGNPHWKGWLSTGDLLELTSLNQLIFILEILITFATKQAILMRRSIVPSLSLQLVFPASSNTIYSSAQCYKTSLALLLEMIWIWKAYFINLISAS